MEYSEEKKFFVDAIEGDYNLSVVKEKAVTIVRMCRETGCNKLLNDLRKAEITSSTMEVYRIPKAIKDAGVPGGFMTAVVVKEMKEEYRFLETVAVNHGHQIKIFSSVEEAAEWLSEEPSPRSPAID